MCGIIGTISKKTFIDERKLRFAADKLKHRGPDGSGEWWSDDGRVGLAHRRLAVIDLSDKAEQPMIDETTKNVIVFNGEIYNYQQLRKDLTEKNHNFKSKSDTEVLLKAYSEWGEGCIEKLNGMFAFALFDFQQQILFLARDRVGEKPLFYHHVNGSLCFASELKALMIDSAFSCRIDTEALDCYLAMGYVPGERCILRGFKKLPPAHAMRFDLQSGEMRLWRYWHLPELDCVATQEQMDETALLDELETLLEESVRRQLVADVPVGVMLSGGVDSSLVTAMAVRTSSKVKTFTVRFPNNGNLDETEHARLIARNFNTEHIELEANPTTVDLLPHMAKQFDEPIVDSSMIPTFLVSRLVRRHCTVGLGGDGGDELFGGYREYRRLLWMQKHLGVIPLKPRKFISYTAEKVLPVGFMTRNWLLGLETDLQHGLPLIACYFDATTRKHLMRGWRDWELVAETIVQERVPQCPDLLQRATRMDFANYLAEDILVKVDRTSMLNSLEVRAPMLDYRLIEFAFSKVPTCLKATSKDTKILLKRLTDRLLPPEFDRKRKQGFCIPLADWLKTGPFRELFHEVLLDSQSIFDQKTVRELLHGQDHARNNGERLFALVLFELWRREYTVVL